MPSTRDLLLALIVLAMLPAAANAQFRVSPYLQNPTRDGMTILWIGNDARPGELIVDGVGSYTSSPALAAALSYAAGEIPLLEAAADRDPPYMHRVRVTGLRPGLAYDYTVRQGDAVFRGTFGTAPDFDSPIRFIVYADAETEPESTGKKCPWARPGGPRGRRYPVDQTSGYAAHVEMIRSRGPDFIAVAGDLVESGGEQRDWDEFWRHNAGALGTIAGSSPIFPAIGNHEIYGGTDDGWQDLAASRTALARYRTYFELPDNGAAGESHHERYYRVDYGSIALITLDSTNGVPHGSDQDTSLHLYGEGELDDRGRPGESLDFNPGSAQYLWLEAQLADARATSRFVFVQFHHSPYSVGPHGFPVGEAGEEEGEEPQSGRPMRALTPLFARHGVDAVFTGHDEMYEHSVVDGVHFFDVGIGGDGLRGPCMGEDGSYFDETVIDNEHQVFLAHLDAPEVWEGQRLICGGKHYGHMEVNTFADDAGGWKAELIPVHLFPLMDETGIVTGWERRVVYDDVTLLTSRYVPPPMTWWPWLLAGLLLPALVLVVLLGRRQRRQSA